MSIKQMFFSLILLTSFNLLSIASFSEPTFDEFVTTVLSAQVLSNDDISKNNKVINHRQQSLITEGQFLHTFSKFKELSIFENRLSSQAQQQNWAGILPNFMLYPNFGTKISVAPASQVAFHGDLHGDVHSLVFMIRFLQGAGIMEGFEIKPNHKDTFYLVFLGDYVDRGWYGFEVLYTLMRLKIANPNNVFLLRGNHEDVIVNKEYEFPKELEAKGVTGMEHVIREIYEYLPSVLYISCEDSDGKQNVLQCNHGGIEFGFNPKPLLEAYQKQAYFGIEKLDREPMINKIDELKKYVRTHKSDLQKRHYANTRDIEPLNLGFLWNDFIVPEDIKITYTKGRGFALGKQITEEFLNKISTNKIKIRGIFRAHQHSGDMMNLILNSPDGNQYSGVAKLWHPEGPIDGDKLWDKIVYTLNAPPFSVYGAHSHYIYDAFIILMLAENFSDWRMWVQHTMLKPRSKTIGVFPGTNNYLAYLDEQARVTKRPRKPKPKQREIALNQAQIERMSFELKELSWLTKIQASK